MSINEKNEIQSMPDKYRPVGAWSYFWHNVLYSLPVIGLIFLIINAIGHHNVNIRSYARSFFCIYIIWIIIAIVCLSTGTLSAVLAAMGIGS